MKITNRIFTKENGKWIQSRREEIEFNFIRWKLDFHLVIGVGYFTAYEDENIKVKTFMLPFFSITELYRKTKNEIK